MIVKSLFIPKHKILLASYLFLLADISFLTFFFLDSGGEIVFCHNVIFSPEYGSCSETVELFHIPLLIFSGIITILAIKTLYYACSTSPDYKDSLKKFLKFFIPSSILLLLLGLIPISAGFGLLGSVNIFLFFPFLILLTLIFVISIYYIILSKKKSVLRYLFAVIISPILLVSVHIYLLSLLESIADHDRNLLDSVSGKEKSCDGFWYDRYEERCLERAYKRSLRNQQ